MPRVVYLDPLWVLDAQGNIDPSLAVLEHEIFGHDIDVAFAPPGGYDDAVRGADAIVTSRAQITPALLDAAGPGCRVVGRLGVGYDNLNVALLRERGIFGFNVPDYCVDEVSSHALGLLLALERRIGDLDRAIKAGVWNSYGGPAPRRLSSLTLGIVGFGTIGRATARKATAIFGRIVAYDPYVHADLMAGMGVAKVATCAELVTCADSVTVHALLSAETRGLIADATLAGARHGTLLVNTARGGIVEPSAVLAALRDGRLGGYGSDVFTPEDPGDDPVNAQILREHNVLVTPHSAFRSDAAERSQRRRIAESVRAVVLEGEPPRFGRLA
jgi:D-3-phosphoglycerate dehydrogenase